MDSLNGGGTGAGIVDGRERSALPHESVIGSSVVIVADNDAGVVYFQGFGKNSARIVKRSVRLAYEKKTVQVSFAVHICADDGSGGEAAREKSLQASRRLSELDPSSPPISTTIRTEQGELNVAYEQAADYLRRHPDFSMAHFWMSYVFRYGGLLEEAGKECDAGLAIDPGFNVLRTCATTFIQAGDYAHAQRYISVAQDPGFEALMRMHIALRTGNAAEVLAEANSVEQMGYHNMDAKLAHVCLSHPSESELAKAVAEVESDPVASRDHELLYENADALAFCEQPDAAVRELQRAINGNYCSYPAMDKDPLFDSIRQRPEYAELRQAGIRCQQSFLSHRKQVKAD